MRLVVGNETFLRRPSEPVTLREGRELGREMVGWLERHNKKAARPGRPNRVPLERALGVSAVQLGVHKAVCVTVVGGQPLVLVNPRVVDRCAALVSWTEGCLSLPGAVVETRRHAWVTVEADNLPGARVFGPKDGLDWAPARLLAAVVVQHEIDHTRGRLIVDFPGAVRAPARPRPRLLPRARGPVGG